MMDYHKVVTHFIAATVGFLAGFTVYDLIGFYTKRIVWFPRIRRRR